MTGKKHPTAKTGRKPNLDSKRFSISTLKSLNVSLILTKLKNMNRNTALVLSLTAILLVVGSLALITTNSDDGESIQSSEVVSPTETADLLGVELAQKEGTVQIKTDESDWTDIKESDTLTENTSLRTIGAASRAVIVFEKGSELRIDANSEVTLQTLSKERLVIRHVDGYTYNRVNPNSETLYIVSSDGAQYEASGTAFRTSATGDEHAVEVFHNSVVETATNKDVREGEKYIVESKSQPANNETIQKLNINQVKDDSFLQWNRDLDKQNPIFQDSLGFLSDFEAPNLSLNTSDGEIILLDPSAKEGTIEITGKTDTSATLRVKIQPSAGDGDVAIKVSDDGTFKTPVLNTPIKEVTFTFTSTDRVGNSTVKSIRVTFQKKSSDSDTKESVVVSLTENTPSKMTLTWKLKGGLDTSEDGVKIVYSTARNPVYGSSESVSEDASTSYSFKKKDFPDKSTYYFKVCVYSTQSNTCTNYSNELKVDL